LSELIEKIFVISLSLAFAFMSVPNIINTGAKIGEEYFNLMAVNEFTNKLDDAINQVLMTNTPYEVQIIYPENIEIQSEGLCLIIKCLISGHETFIKKSYPMPIRLTCSSSQGKYVLRVTRFKNFIDIAFMEE
jgi:hypothetical protein